MVVKNFIEDGKGHGNKVMVTDDNELLTTLSTCPPLLPQKNKIFRQHLTIDGTSTGSIAMNVNGGTTNIEFYIKADEKNDIYITQLNFLVAYGGSSNLGDWCDSGGVLTNGFRLYYETKSEIVDIHDAIKFNGDLIRLGTSDITSEWELQDVASQNDYGMCVTINFLRYVPLYGIKLDRATQQRLVFLVRDDNRAVTTGCDYMNAIAYGFQRFE